MHKRHYHKTKNIYIHAADILL